MVYLIRHAHAGDKHQWPGRDGDRPLLPGNLPLSANAAGVEQP